MVSKEKLIEVARKGNFTDRRMGHELACAACGCYDYEDKHQDDCPVGALLELIEDVCNAKDLLTFIEYSSLEAL